MDVKSFYKRKFTKVVTIREAVEEVASHRNPRSIVILPPDSGDTALDSDVEDIPDSLANDEVVFETAGKAEVEYCQSSESEPESYDEAVEPAPKRQKRKTQIPARFKDAKQDKRKAAGAEGCSQQKAEFNHEDVEPTPKREKRKTPISARYEVAKQDKKKAAGTEVCSEQKAEFNDEDVEPAAKRQKRKTQIPARYKYAKQDKRKTAGTELSAEQKAESSMQSNDENAETVPEQWKKIDQVKNWRKSSKFHEPLSQDSHQSSLADDHPELIVKSPFELWQEIFDDAIMDLLVEQTLLYATRDRNEKDFTVDRNEISRLLGIILLSGYHSLPNETDYWRNQPDLGVTVVSESLSKNRYMAIKRNLHLADNQNLETGNKAAKVKPLYELLNNNLTKFGVWHRILSIDESMVPYFGRSSLKMYIRGKPIRFGFKLWSLCATNGYPYHLKIYTGRDTSGSSEPLGTRVVKSMVDIVSSCSCVESHCLYFDNFFTSYQLLSELKEMNVRATGTVRQFRTGGLHTILPSDKDMKKEPRGSFDYRSDGNVFVVKWHDNSVVTLASNFETHLPVRNVSRRVKGQSNTYVAQPNLVKSYNEGMGGVDVMDRLLGSYRPLVRGKKWWWPLFTNALNITVIAAWRLHCELSSSSVSHMDFRREITLCLLKAAIPNPRRQTVGGHLPDLPADIRLDNIGHEKVYCSQGRCHICQKNTVYKCQKCDKRLHADRGKLCFAVYHTKY